MCKGKICLGLIFWIYSIATSVRDRGDGTGQCQYKAQLSSGIALYHHWGVELRWLYMFCIVHKIKQIHSLTVNNQKCKSGYIFIATGKIPPWLVRCPPDNIIVSARLLPGQSVLQHVLEGSRQPGHLKTTTGQQLRKIWKMSFALKDTIIKTSQMLTSFPTE